MPIPGSTIRRTPAIAAWLLLFLALYLFAYPILIELMEKYRLFDSIPEPALTVIEATLVPLRWLSDFPLYESYIFWVLDLID